MIDPRLKNIIKKLFLIDSDRVIFFTDRPFQYIPLTNRQLNKLKMVKEKEYQQDFQFNIYSTSISDTTGDVNKTGTMKLLIENNRSLILQPKNILIYISNNNIEFEKLKYLFKSFYSPFSLFRYLRTPISVFSYVPKKLMNLMFLNIERYKIIEDNEQDFVNIPIEKDTNNI